MITPPYELALIPCTARKNPLGTTPVTLYMGGPFSLMMKHAQRHAQRIVIMSAKYGLLDLHDPVSYYDVFIEDLSDEQRLCLRDRVRSQAGKIRGYTRILSYVPAAYFALLEEALPDVAARCARPYKSLRMLTLYKVLSQELHAPIVKRHSLL